MRNSVERLAALFVVIAAIAPAVYTFSQISSGIA